MKILVTLVFTCCAAAASAVPVLANDSQQSKLDSSHSAPRPPSRWWTTEKYRQELRLTAEQSAEIERIVQGSMARLKGDKEDLDQAQSDFRQLMERPSASERDLLKAAERLEMARFSISKERTMMLVRIHSVLTPEQRRGLDAIAKRHEAERNRQK
jgi:Spy/CpxP family protein refolding chaperone